MLLHLNLSNSAKSEYVEDSSSDEDRSESDEGWSELGAGGSNIIPQSGGELILSM